LKGKLQWSLLLPVIIQNSNQEATARAHREGQDAEGRSQKMKLLSATILGYSLFWKVRKRDYSYGKKKTDKGYGG
jgi:hypothetical protein